MYKLKVFFITIAFYCSSSLLTQAQDKQGVNFLVADNWQQVLTTAKNENKMIFIDAIATWCGPCKLMDKNIYSDKEIGSLINSNFISIKLQIDSTSYDDLQVQNWYTTAKLFRKLFNITALPSFIFLTPDGNFKYMAIGYKTKEMFKDVTKNAIRSTFPQLLLDYKENSLRNDGILKLCFLAKRYFQDSLSLSIAKQYKAKIWDTNSPDQILDSLHADFLSNFSMLFSSKDQIIRYLYEHEYEADELVHKKGFSRLITDFIITREFLNPIIWQKDKPSGKVPKWDKLETHIATLYDKKTAHRNLLNAKITYYGSTKDWDNYIAFNMEKLDTEGIVPEGMGGFALNNFIYSVVFKYSTKKSVLLKCAEYMAILVEKTPNDYATIDTYSCILYKAGEKDKAIAMEKEALRMAEVAKDSASVIEFNDKIAKMIGNLQTW